MTEIIPAINSENFQDIKEKIQRVQGLARWVHIDIADSTFTKNKLWNNPEELKNHLADKKDAPMVEVHLMVENPETVAEKWIAAGARRIIVHIETIKNFALIKAMSDKARVFFMLAIAPQTDVTELDKYFDKNIVNYQVLAVHPGLPGQSFIESSYEKLRYIRKHCPHCDMEIDGGVNADNIKKCYTAGANLFVSASAIFNESDAAENIAKLHANIKPF